MADEESCTEVRSRWENLIKASHWENSISVHAEKKKDMTGTLFTTLSIALVIKHSVGISVLTSQYIHNVLRTQSLEAIHLNDVRF